MRKLSLTFWADEVWSKVVALTTVLFFVLLADAILSDFLPVYMQGVFGSPLTMGLVMSFSSVVGLLADVVFPQLLKGMMVKGLLLLAVLSGVGFAIVLLGTTFWTIWPLFLLAMAVWGIYYELLSFASQQFVAETAPVKLRSSIWAVMGVFRSLAYFLGPIIGGILAVRGDRTVIVTAGVISLLAYGLLFFLRSKNRQVEIEHEEINLVRELGHWWTLLEHVWPMLVASLVLGLVDATFWTTGAVFTEILAKENWWGGMFLSAYMLPSLFVGFVFLKWGIYQGKKKWAELFMLLGGLLLSLLAYKEAVFFELGVVFVASTFLAVSYPLIDAVYSDIVVRMGRERKHLMGLTSSMISLAYIAGPVLSGWITGQVGERMTFVVMGATTAVVAAALLVTTPKKLRLPQTEMANWE